MEQRVVSLAIKLSPGNGWLWTAIPTGAEILETVPIFRGGGAFYWVDQPAGPG